MYKTFSFRTINACLHRPHVRVTLHMCLSWAMVVHLQINKTQPTCPAHHLRISTFIQRLGRMVSPDNSDRDILICTLSSVSWKADFWLSASSLEEAEIM